MSLVRRWRNWTTCPLKQHLVTIDGWQQKERNAAEGPMRLLMVGLVPPRHSDKATDGVSGGRCQNLHRQSSGLLLGCLQCKRYNELSEQIRARWKVSPKQTPLSCVNVLVYLSRSTKCWDWHNSHGSEDEPLWKKIWSPVTSCVLWSECENHILFYSTTLFNSICYTCKATGRFLCTMNWVE